MTLAKPLPPVRGADLPYDDGIPLESEWHVAAMTLLIDILRYHWRERRDIYVAGNMTSGTAARLPDRRFMTSVYTDWSLL